VFAAVTEPSCSSATAATMASPRPAPNPFEFAVLHPGRTLLEKLLVHALAQQLAPSTDASIERRNGRHFYDVALPPGRGRCAGPEPPNCSSRGPATRWLATLPPGRCRRWRRRASTGDWSLMNVYCCNTPETCTIVHNANRRPSSWLRTRLAPVRFTPGAH
jgi:hypothetical protein